MIAAARLGQRVASVGQLGEDVYGAFFRRVMQVPAAAPAMMPLVSMHSVIACSLRIHHCRRCSKCAADSGWRWCILSAGAVHCLHWSGLVQPCATSRPTLLPPL